MQFIVSLIILGLFFGGTSLLSKQVMNIDFKKVFKDAMKDKPNKKNEGLEEKEFKHYLSVYAEFFRTLNIRSLASISTDLFYHSLESVARQLTRLGLRREITIITKDSTSETQEICTIGKIAWLTQEISCQYNEQLIDSVNGKVLENKQHPSSKFVMSLNKNPLRQKETMKFCRGCGGELQTNGEISICHHCGATYHSDSASWVLNNAYATAPPLKNPIMLISSFGGIFMMLLPIVSFISLFAWKLESISNMLNILAFLFIIGYGIFAIWYYGALLKLHRYDKLCSMFRVMDRIEFLVYHFMNCRSDNRSRFRQFMDEQAYQSWLQTDIASTGNYILDYKMSAVSYVTNYSISGGRQHLKIKMPMTLTVFNEQTRRLTKVNRTVNFGIYRNQKTVYQNNLTSDVFICKGCGMSVNMTADGKCRFCGTTYDVAEYDWKIEWMDQGLYI